VTRELLIACPLGVEKRKVLGMLGGAFRLPSHPTNQRRVNSKCVPTSFTSWWIGANILEQVDTLLVPLGVETLIDDLKSIERFVVETMQQMNICPVPQIYRTLSRMG
jgi:hypothetical protein